MQLVVRHGLRNIGRFILLGCRRSIHLRSIHAAPGSSSGAADPRWVMLNTYPRSRGSVADAKTVADAGCATSMGRHLRIYSGIDKPPASSVLYYDWTGSAPVDGELSTKVIAAHGDSVLLEMGSRTINSFWPPIDYFVYRASTAQAPALSLLPMGTESGRPTDNPRERMMFESTTGLLRRSDDELLVAELGFTHWNVSPEDTADLCVLNVGGSEWDVKRNVPIIIDEGDQTQCWPRLNRVVPVGDRFLCWVNYIHGFLMCDMSEASPRLRYVPLPVPAASFLEGSGSYSDNGWIEKRIQRSRSMCAAGDGGAVRLVSVDPRCCCGGPVHGESNRSFSRFAFTVTTWTGRRLSMDDPVRLVKECVLDCQELWAQPGYEGLPRVPLEHPVVSLDNPDVVCFIVRQHHFIGNVYEDGKIWMIEVDTRSKALWSVICTYMAILQLPVIYRQNFHANRWASCWN